MFKKKFCCPGAGMPSIAKPQPSRSPLQSLPVTKNTYRDAKQTGGKESLAAIAHDARFFQAEDGIRYVAVTGVQTCALPISACHAMARSGCWGHGMTCRLRSPASAA